MSKDLKIRKVAGGVVINLDGKVVLVKTNKSHWVLPKGGIEKGESGPQAAEREIQEEAGIDESDLEFKEELGSYERPDMGDKNEIQQITLFLFSTSSEYLKTKRDKQSLKAKWVELDKVKEMLSAKGDKEFFETIREKVREAILEYKREYENDFSEIKLR
jgi:8-oxo-dGTP pyrophosphatase MutT (NUDIX family)